MFAIIIVDVFMDFFSTTIFNVPLQFLLPTLHKLPLEVVAFLLEILENFEKLAYKLFGECFPLYVIVFKLFCYRHPWLGIFLHQYNISINNIDLGYETVSRIQRLGWTFNINFLTDSFLSLYSNKFINSLL